MLSSANSPLRMWWAGDEIGWVIDTTFGLSKQMMAKCEEFQLGVQKDRLHSLLPGERRDECLRTIKALENHRIRQNIVGVGDHPLFDAYKSDKKLYGLGAP